MTSRLKLLVACVFTIGIGTATTALACTNAERTFCNQQLEQCLANGETGCYLKHTRCLRSFGCTLP
ncbi:hypothetical protein [Luteimonas sp. R10]|uniref:hypothetical protein n=1 Tax=Luteimonas sp. R10 TaxID=3108176 RepID=UPI003088F9A3|nr:hypothetical protein U3649_16945 [Luteimonas sp. R10]